jgi:hypothetical protein
VDIENFFPQLEDAFLQRGVDFAANFWNYWSLTSAPPTWFQNIQQQMIFAATSVFQPDLLIQESFYYTELGFGHNIIVVAHSQGNLYVNQAYTVVTSLGGANLFHIIGVASPDTYVAGAGQYFTLHGDIITLVPGSLQPNITNDPPSPCPASISPLTLVDSTLCHSFDSSYIDDKNDPQGDMSDMTRPAIINAVLANLSPSVPPTWTQRFPASSPPAREYASMAYDEARGTSVVFGGYGSNSGQSLTDTWTWDGQTWSQLHPAHTPDACSGAMAYDHARQVTILFQVCNGTGATWSWNGSDWTRILPTHSPTTVSPNGMAYDAATQSILLFGGSNQSSILNVPYGNETWVWSGSDWLHVLPSISPPGRQAHAMVYDEIHQQVVLFGGISSSPNTYPNDTWVWNGVSWTQESPTVSPQPMYGHTMSYDVQRGDVVLVGSGNLTYPASSFWTWSGSNWSLGIASNPFVPFGQAMTYDRSHSETVLLVTTGQQPNFVSQTWIMK